MLLAAAGNETTRHTISHGLLALLEHPEELARLRDAGDDLPLRRSAAEEMLRWATPVHHFRRTAAVDTELAGTKIAAGDKVTTWFASGNRDESVFENPDVFDIARTPNRHMAFGPGGIHHCMGAHLAKMEVRIAFEELLSRVDRDRARRTARAAALELLQRHQAAAGEGDAPVITLGRLDHVALRVADLDEAATRWAAQFGLTMRARGEGEVTLSCDDEPRALVLLEAGSAAPGFERVGWELAHDCSLAAAAAHLDGLGIAYERGTDRLALTDLEGNALQILAYRDPSPGHPRLVAHARPARQGLPVGHPRKLGHVNFLTAQTPGPSK